MATVQGQQPVQLTMGGIIFRRAFASAVCFAVVLFSTMSVPAGGLPLLGPDFDTCVPVYYKAGPQNCCMITEGRPIKDFQFNLSEPIRIRKPAHTLDEEFISKYERAMELMRALPADDPRSHIAQANIHCAYCSRVYDHLNGTNPARYDVHHSWLFLPFHRWYTYFHERILAKLIDDDTFAIPYWAWDVQRGSPQPNAIPAAYARNTSSSLYNAKRDPMHLPPAKADLGHANESWVKTDDELLEVNSFVMWGMMKGDVKTSEAFYGEKYAQGDYKFIGDAVFESTAHAHIHAWVGSPADYHMDMFPTFSAAREPLFYAHHSQVDRLWQMWKKWGGKDLADTDWLDAKFVFYDENGDLVRVSVRQSLDFDNFRIAFEDTYPDWLNYEPKSIRDTDPKYAQAGGFKGFLRQVVNGGTYTNFVNVIAGYFQPEKYGAKVTFGGVQRAMLTSRVPVPEVVKSSSGDASSVYDDVLVIAGTVEKPFDVDVEFFIFLELPEADENTPRNCVEFLGSVKVEGSDDKSHSIVKDFRKTSGIGERLRIMNVVRQKSITITFVPAWDQIHDSDVSVTITDLTVERKLAR